MSRMPAPAATALGLCLFLSSGAAEAFPWSRRPAQPAQPAQAPAAQPQGTNLPAASAAAPQRTRATAAERAAAARLEPLAQVAFWSRETELNAADVEGHARLAAALRALGRFEEAAGAAGRAMVLQPDHVDGLFELARARIAQGQGFYAVEPLTRLQTLQPRDWRAPSLLGVAYHQTQRPQEAQAAWTQALALSPENPDVLSNMALAAAADGDLAASEALLRRAAARPQANARVRQNLVLVLGLQGKLAEAETLARRDLPPEAVENNLAWLRAGAPSGGAARSWDALRGSTSAN